MSNGGYIGFRNLPTPQLAKGVWNVQDAYNADRDAQWPRWPQNYGLPYDSRLRMWIESDYGLYQDVDANVPVTDFGQPVRSWINRGNAGRLINNRASPPTKSTTQSRTAVYFGPSAQKYFDPLTCNRRAYNYTFVASHEGSGSRALIVGPETTGESGSLLRYAPAVLATSNLYAYGKGSTGWSETVGGSPAIIAQLSKIAALGSATERLVVSRGNAPLLATEPADLVTPGPANITVGGVPNQTPGASELAIYALLWYSSDTPMTVAEVNLVYKYLGDKYGLAYPVLT